MKTEMLERPKKEKHLMQDSLCCRLSRGPLFFPSHENKTKTQKKLNFKGGQKITVEPCCDGCCKHSK